MMIQLIVSAAIRNRKNPDLIICGARHGNCLNQVLRLRLDEPSDENWECGFIDQHNKFLTRTEAWAVADKAGQIRRPYGLERNYDSHRKANIGDEGLLFSENLY